MCDALTTFLARLPSEGTFSVWYGPAAGEPWLTRDADARHYAASTMKLALLVAAYRAADQGDLVLDSEVVVHDDFPSVADGTRFIMSREYDNDDRPWDLLGGTASLRWLLHRAIVSSSNLATNVVVEQVGLSAVAATLAALGRHDSVVPRGIEDARAAEAGMTNLVTATDLARLLQALASGTAASARSCEEMLATLRAQQVNDAIPAGLPAGVAVAHKSGWVEGVSHDRCIVGASPGLQSGVSRSTRVLRRTVGGPGYGGFVVGDSQAGDTSRTSTIRRSITPTRGHRGLGRISLTDGEPRQPTGTAGCAAPGNLRTSVRGGCQAALVEPVGADPFVLAVLTTSALTEREGTRLIAACTAAAWSDWANREEGR